MPKKILYLAPEIPALSATFVYNEILAVRSLGVEVSAASVHKPAQTVKVDGLNDADVFYIYASSSLSKIQSLFVCLFTSPVKTCAALALLFKDVISTKVFTRLSTGLFYRFLNATSLAKYIKDNHFEHLHIHFAHVPTDIGMYAAKISGIDFSVMAHANDIFERGWLLSEKIERSKFFATISDYNIRKLSSQTSNREKLKVIHCGITTTKFKPRQTNPNNEIFKLGFVGRLVEKKGTIFLLQAINRLNQMNVQVELEIIGDGPEIGSLTQYINKNKLTNVRLLGKKPNNEIIDWLATLNCFVLPCVKDKQGDMDGIPVSLMEAMMIGVPVISTTISGIPELVNDKQTGFTCIPGDVDGLAETIENLMAQTEQVIEELITSAREHILSEFEQQKNAELLLNLIESGAE